MYAEFDAENFPPEAVALLRLLGKNAQPVSVEQMEHHLDLSERSLGRAIRRLVSYHLIQLDYNGAYQLTSRGRAAYQQVADPDSASTLPTAEVEASAIAPIAEAPQSSIPSVNGSQNAFIQTQPITRRLTFVVQPLPADLSQPITVFVGVNTPSAQSQLANALSIALQLTAVGCTLSRSSLAIDIPADRAASPETFTVTIESGVQNARVRADIYQLDEYGDSAVIAATYFDLPLAAALLGAANSPHAYGITLTLH